MNNITKDELREVARDLQPTWSDEQFDAHWQAFAQMKRAVERGRRKQAKKKI